MQTARRAFIVLTAAVLMLSALPVLAQQSAQPQAAMAQGQLQKVDASAKTLSIRTAQGTPMEFRFTEETKVIGAEGEVAGLATKAGSDVTVKYIQQDKANVATEIQVHPKK
jgi:hypothetical protein